MKTLVVLSDSHGNRRAIDGLDGIFAECDYIVHLGDTSADGAYIRSKYPNKTIVINGNCDPIKLGEDERVLEIEGVKIFAAHGHRYSVKSTLLNLKLRAEELGCAVALYGHTHAAREDVLENITLINPGVLSRYSQKSYCYIVIHDKNIVAKCVNINDI